MIFRCPGFDHSRVILPPARMPILRLPVVVVLAVVVAHVSAEAVLVYRMPVVVAVVVCLMPAAVAVAVCWMLLAHSSARWCLQVSLYSQAWVDRALAYLLALA